MTTYYLVQEWNTGRDHRFGKLDDARRFAVKELRLAASLVRHPDDWAEVGGNAVYITKASSDYTGKDEVGAVFYSLRTNKIYWTEFNYAYTIKADGSLTSQKASLNGLI